MKPTHKLILLLLTGVGMWGLVGCGGGDDDPSSEPGTLTKAELIEQGDAICAETNAALGELGAEAAESKVPDTLGESISLYTEMVERLQGLGTPVDDDGSYARFRRAAAAFAEAEANLKSATESSEPMALSDAATKAASTLQEFRSQAALYGFEECSKDAQASG